MDAKEMNDWNAQIIAEFRANDGKVGGPFEGAPMVLVHHTGDIAAAVDVELAPTDRIVHIARLAWRTLPYAFAQDGGALAGPVAFDLGAPSGETWAFVEGEPTTTIVGPAIELCAVAARRVDPASTALVAKGPDGADVLRLVRTYA